MERIASGAAPGELESDTLEFKQDARSRKESMAVLADAAVCFANAEGGTIVVGVADSTAGPEAIVGTRLDAMLVKQRTDKRRGVDWSAGFAQSSPADIEPEVMQAARKRLHRADDEHRGLADSSDMDLLRMFVPSCTQTENS